MYTQRFGRIFIGIGIVILALGGMGGCQTGVNDTDIVVVSLPDVIAMVKNEQKGESRSVIFIDPRAPKYYQLGHLPGAINYRLPDAREKAPPVPSIQKHRHIVVYGQNPGSAVARAMFKRMYAIGYARLQFYPGGVEEWIQAGYSLEGQLNEQATRDDDSIPATKPAAKTGKD